MISEQMSGATKREQTAITTDALRCSPLQAIGHELRTQDNRITSHPIFMVQQKRRLYGFGGSDNKVWMLDGEECEPRERGAVLVGYIDIWMNVQPFFTEAGAKRYLESNGHNLKEPRIYVESGWRNEEWQTIRNFILTREHEETDLLAKLAFAQGTIAVQRDLLSVRKTKQKSAEQHVAALSKLVSQAARLVVQFGSSIEQEPVAERFAAECNAALASLGKPISPP